MIPPRLRAFLVRCFIHTIDATRGPNIGKRRVHMGDNIQTANLSAMDLRTLERKGLVTYERMDHMSAVWGVTWFSIKLTEAGKEEIADEFARRCAEADAMNAKLANPDPHGDAREAEAGSESVRVRPRS